MIFDRLFRPRGAVRAGRALYSAAVDQARTPALYQDLATPDTAEGRFEIYSLHVVLLLDRLRGHGPAASDVSQTLFDTYVTSLDHALREMGVGDLSVGKKMRKLGEAFFGRAKSYEAAFAAFPQTTELSDLVARTIYAEAGAPTEPMVAYIRKQRDGLAIQPLEGLLAGEDSWVKP
ncbi:ubiquinol-cytochrome C chaperone family protein [Phenylobacterium immobile]|uniref:ubiquinol-cytochrome C chaperone family protein n=1 Tax=Phenylobacterium immobile TaxID=21 RepID=UPI000B26D885|nr:ubiquinol-cytochrome C chaperone family protein [Phenylobacterium immobile]